MKRKLCALLLAVSMALAMTACGGDSNEEQKKPADGETSQEEQGDKEKEPEGKEDGENAASGDEIVLNYWAQWSENESGVPALKDAIARFEEKHPGFKVEVNWAGRDVRDILRASLDSGVKIDIVESGYTNIVGSLGEEYCQDLTSYMAGSDFEASITKSVAAFTKSYASDGESWYYIPARPFVGTFYYNKAIFEEAGVDTMPTTWAEFLDCCQKIKDAGYDPITVDDAYQQSMYGHYLAMIKGVDWMTKLMTEKDSELWNDAAVLQMAKDFAELREKGYLSSTVGSNVFPAAQNGEFALGTAAMYYNGSWLINEIADIAGEDFQWGTMFFPAPEGSQYPYTTYTTGCQFYAVTKQCEYPEEALALLEEFSSVETQKALLETADAMPVIDGIEITGNLKCVIDLMEASTDAFVWGGNEEEDSDIRAIVNAAFTELVAGNTTPEQFVKSVQDQLK